MKQCLTCEGNGYYFEDEEDDNPLSPLIGRDCDKCLQTGWFPETQDERRILEILFT